MFFLKHIKLLYCGAVATFYSGFKMGIFVKHCHLLFPVKLMSPVRNHFLEIARVKTIVKAGVL